MFLLLLIVFGGPWGKQIPMASGIVGSTTTAMLRSCNVPMPPLPKGLESA